MKSKRRLLTLILISIVLLLFSALSLIIFKPELFPFIEKCMTESSNESLEINCENDESITDEVETEFEFENNEEAQEKSEFDVYFDNFVKFKYPKGKIVTVNSGDFKHTSGEDIVGAEKIKIEDLKNIGILYSGGITSVEYDLDKPNVIKIECLIGMKQEFDVKEVWYGRLDNGLYLFSVEYDWSVNNETEPDYKKVNVLLIKE